MRSISKKVDIKIAHLTEGEFCGHETWFKEEINKIFYFVEDTTPEEPLNSKLTSMKKDFTLTVLETDTVVFKISRKRICE